MALMLPQSPLPTPCSEIEEIVQCAYVCNNNTFSSFLETRHSTFDETFHKYLWMLVYIFPYVVYFGSLNFGSQSLKATLATIAIVPKFELANV